MSPADRSAGSSVRSLEPPGTAAGGPAPAAGSPGRSAGPRTRRAGQVSPWLAAPAAAGLIFLLVYPTVYLVGLAVTRSSLARPLRAWTGIDNFIAAKESLAFPGSLWRSVVFACAGAAIQLTVGLAVALLLRIRGTTFGVAGTFLLLPLVTPPVMVGVAWKLLLAPVGGAMQGVWSALGVPGFNPLGSANGAFLTLLIIDSWQWTPFVVLLVYTALLGVDDDLLEAASLDGAGAWRSFRAVVWPSILPTLLSVALLKVVVGFKVFDLVVVVTEGGPGTATNLAPYEIFRTGLRGDYDMGVAAAETIVFGLVVAVVTTVLTLLRDRAVRAEL